MTTHTMSLFFLFDLSVSKKERVAAETMRPLGIGRED